MKSKSKSWEIILGAYQDTIRQKERIGMNVSEITMNRYLHLKALFENGIKTSEIKYYQKRNK